MGIFWTRTLQLAFHATLIPSARRAVPSYWAAVTLIGEPGPLEVRQR